MVNIDDARNSVNEIFDELNPIVIEIVESHSVNINNLIRRIDQAKTLTNNELRDLMLNLSVEAYLFSIDKDSSLLKQECSTAIMKESQASVYNRTEGTQAVRQNQSLISTLDKQVVNMVYSSVANMMKSKLDETHRMINVLNSILISRSAEAKIYTTEKDKIDSVNQQSEFNQAIEDFNIR